MSSPAERAATRVFDLIDAYQLGQAEGALESAISKFPNSPNVRAAEALFLLRSGNTAKAKEKAEALATSEKSTEPSFINALVHVLQQCCCWGALVKTYERVRPLQNEKQIGENLVQTYARMGAYDKVQSNAMQLYRAHGDPRYQAWMVQACLAQVPPDATDHLQLKMATRLLESAVLTEKGVMTFSTARTYVDVLVQQKMFSEAVEFICSERGSKLGMLENRMELLSKTLLLHDRSRAANAVAKALWKLNSDNWAPFELYRNSIEKVAGDTEAPMTLVLEGEKEESRTTIDTASADSSWEAALKLAQELQEVENTERPNKRRRGPYMARLAILQRQGDTSALASSILSYVKIFFNKPCCFLDISVFLNKDSANDVYQWSLEEGEEGESVAARHNRRILGLRAFVSQWGCDANSIPCDDELQTLIQTCRNEYEAARPLSSSLVWSEEGLFDGYIGIALNIALHAYVVKGKDSHWAAVGLELMNGVDRRMNNPSWLIFSVCFAHLLRLTDSAAVRQLAFKDVQHDTMSHLGYWTLHRGLAFSDVKTFVEHADLYYERMERDISLLRAKVFTYVSWPAMQDIKQFEHKQMNSLARVLHTPQQVQALLPDRQTQKSVIELFDTLEAQLFSSLTLLHQSPATLLDNSDWSVVKSMVLANIHSDKATTLAETLVDFPSKEERIEQGKKLISNLLLLRDVVGLEHHLTNTATQKKQSGKGKKATDVAKEVVPSFDLYLPRIKELCGSIQCTRHVQPLATVLEAYLTSSGEQTAADSSNLFEESVKDLTTSPAVLEQFLFGEAAVIVAVLQNVSIKSSPATAWAKVLQQTLSTIASRYDGGEWSLSTAPLQGEICAALLNEKSKRVQGMLAELQTNLSAVMRRK